MVALFATALTIPGSPAGAQTSDLTVQVSQPFAVGANCDQETFRGCRSGESMRFLAPALKVHKGDTLTFDFASFHTASLLPVGDDFLAFRAANTGGVGKPFSLVIEDPDDTTEEGAAASDPAVKANPAVALPSVGGVPADCGAADNPCAYDGTEVVNSGLPLGPPPVTFTTTIDANPGDSFWVICFVHTHMSLRVNVVSDAEATTTQADIDAAKASLTAYDLEWAQATDAKLINKQSSHRTASGKKVYDVFAGKDSHFANLNGFYPRKTTIPKGATVRYHFSNLVYEDHTVTMPAPSAFSLYDEFFVTGCDPDTDSGAGPDNAGDPEAPDPGNPCPDPSQTEIDISSRVFNGIGDGVFRGASDLEHSGLRGAQFGSDFLDVKFAARSKRKGWTFFCMLHPMRGKVVVKPLL
jgi:plastocyanin